MNLKPIAGLARELTQLRGVAIYALIACAALATALYSCSQPPAQRQPAPLPPVVPAIVAATPVPPTPAPPTQTNSRPAPSRIAPSPQTTATQPSTNSRSTPAPITPTPQLPTPQPTPPPMASAPTPKPTTVPDFVPLIDDAQFTHITAGKHHACGLQTDGTALCWGRNINGSLNVPDGLTFRRISAGLNFTCGLRIDGAIACWGSNNHAKASPPDGSFDEIAAGRAHACALDDGALICWGRDFPDGAETIQEIPPLSTIQAGAEFVCGLTPTSDAACWDNRDRELAITPGPFASLAVGLHHACAIKIDGSGVCNEEGLLDYSVPTQPPPAKFAQIASGWRHACGITQASAHLTCWGSGDPGEQGVPLSSPEGEFTALAIGWRNTCALRANGHAVCWQQLDYQTAPPPARMPSYGLNRLSETLGDIKFEEPVELFPLSSGGLAVVEREGTIIAYSDEPNDAFPKTILNLTDSVALLRTTESGMFSAALDPQFEEFPFLYVFYKTFNQQPYGDNTPGLVGRLARFHIVDGQAVKASELTILEVAQPQPVHHGGAIRFGADGMLYLGIGDNAVRDNAQSLVTLLGKIIRLDVRGATPEQPYRIPPDNPFVDNPKAFPEIWAYGLRNPWRMDFAPDGRLFVADVGHILQEEVSIADAGANLGWPMCEGSACEEGVDADAEGLTMPIYAYGREDGCAIIGGRNRTVVKQRLRVWRLLRRMGAIAGARRTRKLANAHAGAGGTLHTLSFGIDTDGTVYILTAGRPIMRLQPAEDQE